MNELPNIKAQNSIQDRMDDRVTASILSKHLARLESIAGNKGFAQQTEERRRLWSIVAMLASGRVNRIDALEDTTIAARAFGRQQKTTVV